MRKEDLRAPSFLISLLFLFGCILYFNTLRAPFYFDDYPSIIFNPKIIRLRDWIGLASESPSRFISYLSFAVNYSIGGTSPFGYHIVNILIHLLNSTLVFAIARILFQTPRVKRTPSFAISGDLIAFSAALIFMCHPVQTQAVTYIIQRVTSMASLFYLATLLSYLYFRISKKRLFFLLSLLTALLSTLTKEISITIPAALLLCELIFFEQNKETFPQLARRLFPFFLIASLIPGLLLLNHQKLVQDGGQLGLIPKIRSDISRSAYLTTQWDVIRTYLRLLILPVRQTLDYDFPFSAGFFSPGTFSSFILILTILAAGIHFIRKQPLASFGIFFFFLALSVESSILPFPDLIFEHRLYLPIAGFSICLATCLARGLKSSRLFIFTLIPLTLVLGTLTYERNAVWANELAFWKDQTQKAPSKDRGYFHLGEIYYKNHQYLLAAESFLNAIQRAPAGRKSDIYFLNLGSAYAQLGEISKAEYWYNKGLQTYPGSGPLYTSLAVLKINSGDPANAIPLLQKAIKAAPETSIAYYELAQIDASKGAYAEAKALLEKAVLFDPFLRPAYELLFKIHKLQGDLTSATNALRKAAEIYPENSSLYVQLGRSYLEMHKENDGILAFRKAIVMAPLSREGYDALALYYAQKGEQQQALGVLMEYLRLRKKHRLPPED